MTVAIKSYVRVGNLFVNVVDVRRRADDEQYVYGCIEMTIHGKAIMTRAEVDLVDQLWSYIVNLCVAADKGHSATTYFPDQPIEFALTPRNATLDVSLRYPGVERKASIGTDEFIASVADSGVAFFEIMKRVTPSQSDVCEHEIARLRALRARRA